MPGDNANKGGNVGDDKVAGGEELQTLKSQMDGMKSEFESLKAAKADMEKRLDDADKELLSSEYLDFIEKKRGGTSLENGVKGTEVNFDEMTPAQIAKHFESKYKGDLEKAATSVQQRMDAIEQGIGKIVAQFDLSMTSMKHRDFGEALETPLSKRTSEQKALVDTVYRVANENPTWNSEKCLRTARLEMKAQVDEQVQEDNARAEKERKSLTEKGGTSASVVQGKQLGKEEAAQKAWEATFGHKDSVD